MGWIRSENGKYLVNLENVRAITVDTTYRNTYCVQADVSDKQAYRLTNEKITEEEATDILSRIERWLEGGAEGVFQV